MARDLIDTHAHLDQVENYDAVLARAGEAGLAAIVAVSTGYASSVQTLALAQKESPVQIIAAIGTHPGEIGQLADERIIQLITDNIGTISAVGEIGLDYWCKPVKKDKALREAQKSIFQKQLQAAHKFSLPVIIHSRGAWKECFQLCRDTGIQRAVFHWYSGPPDVLKEIIAAGYLVSATPALQYSPQHQEAVKNASLGHILVETDSPVFYRDEGSGFASEPKDVARTVRLVSQLLNIPEDEAQSATFKNAQRFFNVQ